jgi:hypothetical protein
MPRCSDLAIFVVTDRRTDRRTDRQTDRQTDGQTDADYFTPCACARGNKPGVVPRVNFELQLKGRGPKFAAPPTLNFLPPPMIR